jgi:hypothetical protein
MISPSEMGKEDEISVAEYRKMIASPGKTKKHVIKGDFAMSVNPAEITALYGLDPETSLYIRGHVYSSKNSKRIMTRTPSPDKHTAWTCNGRAVVPFIADSEGVEAYRKATWFVYKDLAPLFQKRIKGMASPIVVQFTFIRMDEQGFDFSNIVQLILDMMVYYKWIQDDDIKFILPIPPLPPKPVYFVSKPNAGVIITIL